MQSEIQLPIILGKKTKFADYSRVYIRLKLTKFSGKKEGSL